MNDYSEECADAMGPMYARIEERGKELVEIMPELFVGEALINFSDPDNPRTPEEVHKFLDMPEDIVYEHIDVLYKRNLIRPKVVNGKATEYFEPVTSCDVCFSSGEYRGIFSDVQYNVDEIERFLVVLTGIRHYVRANRKHHGFWHWCRSKNFNNHSRYVYHDLVDIASTLISDFDRTMESMR